MTQKLLLAKGISVLAEMLTSICLSLVVLAIGQVERLAGLERSLVPQVADLFQVPRLRKEFYLH